MKTGLRQSMAWLHVWTGLVAGWVLYFVFVTGSVGYFYPEIDRWMRPEQPPVAQEQFLTTAQMLAKSEANLRHLASNAQEWQVILPTGRYGAYLTISWVLQADHQNSQASVRLYYDPNSDSFNPRQTQETGGGNALYLMHERLYYLPPDIGEFIVFSCSVIMLIIILSGIITHKKIFKDFFNFRQGYKQRAWLDLHNLTGVLTLPFLLMITYSGIAFSLFFFFADTYEPAPVHALYDGDINSYFAESNEAYRYNNIVPENNNSPMLPLTNFLDKAKEYWADEIDTFLMTILNPGKANAEVHLRQASSDTALYHYAFEQLHFSAANGQLVRQETATGSISKMTQSVLYGLHEGLFAGTVLRWLYFGSGLLGCITIASGLVLWTVKRRRRQEQNGKPGFRLVEILNIGTIAGLLVGVAAYFWANRLLPVGMENRADWEMHCLFITWGATFVYAALRSPARAWVEIFALGAALYIFLPVLNALTTDRHLGVTLPAGDWVLAGFDLTVFVFGVVLAVIAWKVHRRDALQQSSGHITAVKSPKLAGSSG